MIFGNNNQRKSRQELQLMKLRRAPICEVIVPPSTPTMLKSSIQVDNEEADSGKGSGGGGDDDSSNNNRSDRRRQMLQPVQNQPDLVARSHELSKRRFFEKLQRRESNLNMAKAAADSRFVRTIFEQRQINLNEDDYDEANKDDDQLRVLPLDSNHATRGFANTISDEQIPASITHLDNALSAIGFNAFNSKATPSSPSTSSGASSSTPWLIENHGYASLATTALELGPRSASSDRQYANLVPMPPTSNMQQQQEHLYLTELAGTTSVPVGYATVRTAALGKRIPICQPTAENKRHSTSLGDEDERTSGTESSETDCDSSLSGRQRRRSQSSAANSTTSGGFASLHPTPVALRLIDHNRLVNSNHFGAVFNESPKIVAAISSNMNEVQAPRFSSTLKEEKKAFFESVSEKQNQSSSQRWHVRKSSLLKRFGSLASRAFSSTTTTEKGSANNDLSSTAAQHLKKPAMVPSLSELPPETPGYSTPKPIVAVRPNGATESDFVASYVALIEGDEAVDQQTASMALAMQQQIDDATSHLKLKPDSEPNLRGSAHLPTNNSRLPLAEADLVILPAKNSNINSNNNNNNNNNNNRNINQIGNYNHNYNRRNARHCPKQHLSRVQKSCATRHLRGGSSASLSSSTSSVSLSSDKTTQSSLAYSSLKSSESPRRQQRRHRQRRCDNEKPTDKGLYKELKSSSAVAHQRRACSLSDELESLMSPSEDAAQENNIATTEATSAIPANKTSGGGPQDGGCDKIDTSQMTSQRDKDLPLTQSHRGKSNGIKATNIVELATKMQPEDCTVPSETIRSKSGGSLLRNWFGVANSSLLSLSPGPMQLDKCAPTEGERCHSSLMIDRSHAIISGRNRVSRNESTSRHKSSSKVADICEGPLSMIYSRANYNQAAATATTTTTTTTAAQNERAIEIIEKSSLNICQNILRNYVGRRHHHRQHNSHRHHHHNSHKRTDSHNHHHHHHHHHHRNHNHTGHHQHYHRQHSRAHQSARHGHCVSLPVTSTSTSRGCAAGQQPSALTERSSLSQAYQTSCSSCCSSSVDKTKHSLACVWGQLIKINKSDGSQVVELERTPSSSWGFFVARGAINNVKGIFISRMHDSATSNSLAGLLSIGDRILSIDNCPIQEPNFDILRVNQMISKKSKILLKVKPFKS